jgi:protein-S-isoprenylcysteine O-methyltransferase Ste14
MKKKLISPKYLNGFVVLAFGMHFMLPIRRIIYNPFTFLGIFVILFGLILNIWSVRVLRRNNTPADLYQTTTRLVTNGPFRFSRNPIYLSGVVLLLGITIFLGSLVTFVFPIALLLILDKIYIPFEEKKLEETFDKEYLIYKRKVRRWI